MSKVISQRSGSSVVTNRKHEWFERLARLGYGSRGVIYGLVGGLAFLAAVGQGGQTTDTKGAIAKLMEAPAGWLIVLAIALGLIGYSAWRFCQAVLDADTHGNDAKALAIRGGLFVSSLTHLLLAVWAGRLAFRQATSDPNSGESHEQLVAMIMSHAFGHWIVGIAGVILIGVGVAEFLKGSQEKFERYFTWDTKQRARLIPICKVGLFARGLIFAIIGGFVVYAAITTDPSNAGGLQDALQWIRSQPFGPWLLGFVAAGLVCFAVYSLLEAFYRRIQI